MTGDVIEGVHPTRMELLEISNKLELATKGHKLLKEKRDSLIMEFFQIVDKSREGRGELFEKLEKGYRDLVKAQALVSSETVDSISHGMPERGKIEIDKDHVFGVEIPKINFTESEGKREYSLMNTSAKLDDSVEEFSEIFLRVLKLAEAEEAMRRLGEEIKSTKRRVNALEHVMIPKLKNTQRYIKDHLEEMERENFFRLKMVKKKGGKKKGKNAS